MSLFVWLLPGVLVLGIVVRKIGLPRLKKTGWKRIIDQSEKLRARGDFIKSDGVLEKGLDKYPQCPELYVHYYLWHSNAGDLAKKFRVLERGYRQTSDPALAFFMGVSYLEEGDFIKARAFLQTAASRRYMIEKRIPLLVQLYYEEGDFKKAEKAYIDFYREIYEDISEPRDMLALQSPQDLILYVLIQKALKKPWWDTMGLAPVTGVHADMGWQDYLFKLREEMNNLKPAVTGIYGWPERFNERRREFYRRRIDLIETYINGSEQKLAG